MPKKVVVKEVPDNTVFWSIVGIITLFVIVLAVVMVVRTGPTGQIVYQWPDVSRPFSVNPYACLDVPACGDVDYMCCAENPLPGSSIKCVAPMNAFDGTGRIGYNAAYDSSGYGNPVCPERMPYRCACPEKFQYKQSWPVPSR